MIPRTQADSELDSGPHAQARERLCVATGVVRPVADMIRFVVGPDGRAVPDVKEKLPGRGVWVTATHDALYDAIKRKVFARGFKRDVRLPADLVGQTERLMERAALDALAMAGKAGLVAAGFTKAEIALQREDIVALLHAAEASPDGAIVVVRALTSAQLDLALGRPNVVHAALLAGPPSNTFLARLRRLERFRTGDQAVTTAAPN